MAENDTRIELRDYQLQAVQAVEDYFNLGLQGNPLVVAPTGSGKSHIIAELCKRFCKSNKGILILSHRQEILMQDANKIVNIWQDAPIGIFSAGLKSKRISQITIAGIQSIHRKLDLLKDVHYIIIDEAHLVPKAGSGMYLKLIKELRAKNQQVSVIGFTATPYRLDTGLLHHGAGAIFSTIIYDIPIRLLIEKGFLVPLISKQTKNKVDISQVRISAGEYILSEASAVLNKEQLRQAAVKEVLEEAKDRKSILVFCSGVQHAFDVCEEFKSKGEVAEYITGETIPMERQMILTRFKQGQTRILVNCEVLTTGFDSPATDCIVLLRPTQSTGLYVQMLGRGMRPDTDKKNCLVLDFANNIHTHGPIDGIVITKNSKGVSEVKKAPVKFCDHCGTANHTARRVCTECGAEFPAPEPSHDQTATDAAVMMMNARKPICRTVVERRFEEHQKKGKPPCLRVRYTVGVGDDVSEFVCFQHDGFAARKAAMWWRDCGGRSPIPITVNEALKRNRELKPVYEVWVMENDKFPTIVGKDFTRQELEDDPYNI